MNPDFWRSRWKEGRIGFHEGRPNPYLQVQVGLLGDRRRVLVPLCGKAEDLAFLASLGHEVVGVELVEDAASAFFSEHKLQPARRAAGKLTALSAQHVTILVGDFFDSTAADVGDVNALYDRAALIALPQADRQRYAKHVRSLLPRGAHGLLVTVEYPQDQMDGPPFSVPEVEVRALYAGLRIGVLGQSDAGGRLKQEGIASIEKCYSLEVP